MKQRGYTYGTQGKWWISHKTLDLSSKLEEAILHFGAEKGRFEITDGWISDFQVKSRFDVARYIIRDRQGKYSLFCYHE